MDGQHQHLSRIPWEDTYVVQLPSSPVAEIRGGSDIHTPLVWVYKGSKDTRLDLAASKGMSVKISWGTRQTGKGCPAVFLSLFDLPLPQAL